MPLRAPIWPCPPCSPPTSSEGGCIRQQAPQSRPANGTTRWRWWIGPADPASCRRSTSSEDAQSSWPRKRPKALRERKEANTRAPNAPERLANPPPPIPAGRNARVPGPATLHRSPATAKPPRFRSPRLRAPPLHLRRAPYPTPRPTAASPCRCQGPETSSPIGLHGCTAKRSTNARPPIRKCGR